MVPMTCSQLALIRPFLCPFDPTELRFVFIFHHPQEPRNKQILLATIGDEILAYGSNPGGILGVGHSDPIDDQPKKVDALSGKKIIDFAAGDFHIVALAETGEMYSWGKN